MTDFTPGFYTFDPFDDPVYIKAVTTITEDDGATFDVVETFDAGTFTIAGGFATAA